MSNELVNKIKICCLWLYPVHVHVPLCLHVLVFYMGVCLYVRMFRFKCWANELDNSDRTSPTVTMEPVCDCLPTPGHNRHEVRLQLCCMSCFFGVLLLVFWFCVCSLPAFLR